MALASRHETITQLAASLNKSSLGGPSSVEACVLMFIQSRIAAEDFKEHGIPHDAIVKHLGSEKSVFSTTEVETALSDLVDAEVLKMWQPSGSVIGERPKFYQFTLEFIQLVSKDVKARGLARSNLLESNIKVKGTDVTLADLLGFSKHVPWLLQQYPNLNDLYCGSVKLTREEAAILLGEIEKYKVFE